MGHHSISRLEQVPKEINKKESKRLKWTNEKMHCINHDGEYVVECRGFHAICICV
jgi:hypothetical protein